MGGGPSGHPGVTVVEVTDDLDKLARYIETALEGGRRPLSSAPFVVAGKLIWPFASDYGKGK